VIQNQHTQTLMKENIIQLTCCVCKMTLKHQKNCKKSCKKAHLWLDLLLLKYFLVTHDFLDQYEISTTQTRLVSATFPILLLETNIVREETSH